MIIVQFNPKTHKIKTDSRLMHFKEYPKLMSIIKACRVSALKLRTYVLDAYTFGSSTVAK